MPSTLVVRGSILEKPLLITGKAQAVEVYDCNDELIAVMHHVFNDDMWAVTTKTDDDWNEVLHQLGYIEAARKLNVRNIAGI